MWTGRIHGRSSTRVEDEPLENDPACTQASTQLLATNEHFETKILDDVLPDEGFDTLVKPAESKAPEKK